MHIHFCTTLSLSLSLGVYFFLDHTTGTRLGTKLNGGSQKYTLYDVQKVTGSPSEQGHKKFYLRVTVRDFFLLLFSIIPINISLL